MPDIAEYLTELDRQHKKLAENLNAMGVSATANEKLNTLVPKVLKIQSGNAPAERTVIFDTENQNNIYLKYNDIVYNLTEFTAMKTDFCSPDNDYALNYGTSIFGWDSPVMTCCTTPVAVTPSSQVAMRFLSGSTETGTMRLVRSDSNSPAEILSSTEYIDLPFQWIYSADYVTTLTPCENATSGTYYLVWVRRSNNSHPLIRSITIFP
ncbi:MAG: hypothetical protein NC177_07395 [Ruminococcus flavefaciens]|nr:hypothetical protein [Ruminococcus flavefaciens]